ncbi:hypothetical protein HYS72_03105 [Candidatus Pacearchaeota archaeon]|nr:hypothetical protein [Candidatus Pacearchaeota archaeon]
MAKKENKKNSGSGVVISIVIIAVIVLIILGASLLSKKNTQDETPEEDLGSPQEEIISETSEPTEHIVEITLEGFVPKDLEIKQGDKVTWINKLATEGRPASNFHPTHTNYPGSSIIKCGTAEEKNTFDTCRGLKKGESYSFIFNEVGSWTYHNHLQPSKDGKIIVS